MRRLPIALAALGATVLLASGCGGGGGGDSSASTSEIAASRQLVVFADSSIREPITVFGRAAGVDAANTFGDSSELANRIAMGSDADVYVAAGERLPAHLFGAGLVEKPIAFARKGDVTYTAAEVKGSAHAELANAYVRTLVSVLGAQVMGEAGLQPIK